MDPNAAAASPASGEKEEKGMVAIPHTIAYELAGQGTAVVNKTSEEHEKICRVFLDGMGSVAAKTTVVAVKEIDDWLEAFKASFIPIVRKRGGMNEANVANAFYGTTRDGAAKIIKDSFPVPDISASVANHLPVFGIGCLHLAPIKFSILSALKSVKDEDGLRHVILCHVIRGNVEKVERDSRQIAPSSEEFDTGVDNIDSPTKYIIWNSSIKTHIIPIFTITFSSPDLDDPNGYNMRVMRSPILKRLAIPVLLSKLSEGLNPQRMRMVLQTYHDFQANKVGRYEMIRRFREIAGDELLLEVFMSNEPI